MLYNIGMIREMLPNPETYDFEASYAKKYDELLRISKNKGEPIVPLNLENHRTLYRWAHQFVQAAVMQQLCKNNEVDLIKNTDEWASKFSKEFNEAFREMIFSHPDLLAILRSNFQKTVAEIEMVLKDVCQIEEEVEKDLNFTHSESTREKILDTVGKIVARNLNYLKNRSESHSALKKEVEESMGLHTPE